jgi:hypothetical protein
MTIKDFGFIAEDGDLIVVAARSKKDAVAIIQRDHSVSVAASDVFVF